MTPDDVEKIARRVVSEYMKNVDNLLILENYLVDRKPFLSQIANSLVKDGDFTEELSMDLASSLTPIINDSINTHEKECAVDGKIEEHLKETKEEKKSTSTMFLTWGWEVVKYLLQIIVILGGLVLATDAFKIKNDNPPVQQKQDDQK